MNTDKSTLKELNIGEKTAQLPIIQGGMGVGISRSSLAGAVAREGGIGVISTAQIGYDEEGFEQDQAKCNRIAIGKHVKKAKEIGMKIILNPSPMNEKIKELPLDQINYFLLNEIEAMQILDMEEPKEIDGKYISGLLHQKFPKATIVLTLGSEGSVCISGDEYVEQSIYKVKTVDTTAAGDTYTGYFISGILNGKTIKEAMDTASKASAIAVSRQGAAPSIPCLEEVEEYKN